MVLLCPTTHEKGIQLTTLNLKEGSHRWAGYRMVDTADQALRFQDCFLLANNDSMCILHVCVYTSIKRERVLGGGEAMTLLPNPRMVISASVHRISTMKCNTRLPSAFRNQFLLLKEAFGP